MANFSERYGYVKLSDVVIRERLTTELINAICSCYDRISSYPYHDEYIYLEEYLWMYFLNKRKNDFWSNGRHHIVATTFIRSKEEWYKKLDIIEVSIEYMNKKLSKLSAMFKEQLNFEFSRLNFGYKIVGNHIIEITSDYEIQSIESALTNKFDPVRIHLQKSLELFSLRPIGDYRNSIKESISAVEAFTREITGENTLSFKKMKEKGITLPSSLRKSFETLYGYTNDKTTGIRHALMEDANHPGSDEAFFMLVSCSAFINYLTKKLESQ